jgi:hypothetical protein
MSWFKAMLIWFLIAIAESLHGTLRQWFIAPVLGDLLARQIGVLTGSFLIFGIVWCSISWIGARTFKEQLNTGLVWVALTVLFELLLGKMLGYSWQRILADYKLMEGGFMGFGLLFMLFSPVLAAKLRGVGS